MCLQLYLQGVIILKVRQKADMQKRSNFKVLTFSLVVPALTLDALTLFLVENAIRIISNFVQNFKAEWHHPWHCQFRKAHAQV